MENPVLQQLVDRIASIKFPPRIYPSGQMPVITASNVLVLLHQAALTDGEVLWKDEVLDFSNPPTTVPRMTAEEVNALPEKARDYIHQLETNADPAGMVRENMQLRDTNEGLQRMYRKASTQAEQPGAASPERRSDLVPGVMQCAKCKFQLNRVTLCLSDGNTYAGDSKTEPCPNGCGPLWPVTWEQEARSGWKALEEMHDRLQNATRAAAPGGEAPAEGGIHPDTKRLAWMADGWTPRHEVEYVKHVLQVGGIGDLEDMRTFVDRQMAIDAALAAQSQKG